MEGSAWSLFGMQLTQKTTATFKQLDGVIRATKPDCPKQATRTSAASSTSRSHMIGVSRALESVIFCHQEDSSCRCRRVRPASGFDRDQRPSRRPRDESTPAASRVRPAGAVLKKRSTTSSRKATVKALLDVLNKQKKGSGLEGDDHFGRFEGSPR